MKDLEELRYWCVHINLQILRSDLCATILTTRVLKNRSGLNDVVDFVTRYSIVGIFKVNQSTKGLLLLLLTAQKSVEYLLFTSLI